jgi:hypothetical protein
MTFDVNPHQGLGVNGNRSTYTVHGVVTLTRPNNSQAVLSNQLVQFAVDHGTVNPVNVMTDGTGAAQTTVTLQRQQKATLRATLAGVPNATLDATSEIISIGAGSVNRLGPIHGLKTHLPCWLMPL